MIFYLYVSDRLNEVTKDKLKKYCTKDIHKEDLEIIFSHTQDELEDGTKYFSFTNGKSFKQIKQKRETFFNNLINEQVNPVDKIKKDNRIFSESTVVVNVPEVIVPAHKKEITLFWECNDDLWKTEDC